MKKKGKDTIGTVVMIGINKDGKDRKQSRKERQEK